jgi:HTH domain.
MAILELINSMPAITGAKMSERFSVSEKTIKEMKNEAYLL